MRVRYMKHLILSAAILCVSQTASANPRYEIFPDQKKQTVLGLGFEIQSDSIGSGNNGLPEAAIAVPHDLLPSERERLAKEMLTGFRYMRLAGGLYWRGLNDQQSMLQPRWPEQLSELKELADLAGVEGLSFEYWSPAPYWKANRNYIGKRQHDPENTLRPFGSTFATDPDYKGDRSRFFKDFAKAIVADISTLETAGLKVSMFGLQNEPDSNDSKYPTNGYLTSANYIEAFRPVAEAIRLHDQEIMIFSDTAAKFPSFIAPAMNDPATAKLVDAYVVHTIGYDSATVKQVDARIRTELPPRPWFQNEYEYLTGGATPARTLNTVQHIMNSFQVAGNPTWFWLHALKPAGNAEASGYALGFWNSRIAPIEMKKADTPPRWHSGAEFPAATTYLLDHEMVYGKPGAPDLPGTAFTFLVDQPAEVLLFVEERGGFAPANWVDSGQTIKRGDRIDRVFKKTVAAGEVQIPEHSGRDLSGYGPPHVAFVRSTNDKPIAIEIGVNTPAYVLSQTREIEARMQGIAPGHWTFNDLNWNAVGSFVKRMPWDSIVLEARAVNDDDDARLLVFQKPSGKRTIVVSNRKPNATQFVIDTNMDSQWRAYRYTPRDRGTDTMGIAAGSAKGETLQITVPASAWEFWEEQ